MILKDTIFVFGSNLAGLHGAGAAKFAEKHFGAKRGTGKGLTGNSYALPTKDERIKTLPIDRVKQYVKEFITFADDMAGIDPRLQFQVTRIGCGLAGFTDEQMAPLFIGSPDNCLFDEAWRPWLGDIVKYWGSVK